MTPSTPLLVQAHATPSAYALLHTPPAHPFCPMREWHPLPRQHPLLIHARATPPRPRPHPPPHPQRHPSLGLGHTPAPPSDPCARNAPSPRPYSLPCQHPPWPLRATPLPPAVPYAPPTPLLIQTRATLPPPVRTPPTPLVRSIKVRHAINLLSPPGLYILFRHFGALAQLVARFHGMEEVRGSNPLCST